MTLGSWKHVGPTTFRWASVLSGKFAGLIRDGFSSSVRRATQECRESFEEAQQSCRRKDARSSGVNFPDSTLVASVRAVARQGASLGSGVAREVELQIPTPVFGRRLLQWYEQARRDLPWRDQPDAYRIWVAETMLQQDADPNGTTLLSALSRVFSQG